MREYDANCDLFSPVATSPPAGTTEDSGSVLGRQTHCCRRESPATAYQKTRQWALLVIVRPESPPRRRAGYRRHHACREESTNDPRPFTTVGLEWSTRLPRSLSFDVGASRSLSAASSSASSVLAMPILPIGDLPLPHRLRGDGSQHAFVGWIATAQDWRQREKRLLDGGR